jgi:hypothetical protein
VCDPTRAEINTPMDPTPPASADPPAPRTDAWYDAAFWILLAAGTAAKLAFLAWGTLDLSFDEAYYWAWTRRPDWCYYSKGPGIMAVIRAGTAVAGDTTFGVRFASVVCSVLTATIAYFFLRSFFSESRPALLAILLLGSAPLFAAGGVLSTIDAPFFLCWTAATAALWRAVSRGCLLGWIGVGLASAAGLQCKFTMAFFAAVVLIHVLWESPRLLRTPGPWVALGLALASLTPILLWNSRHEWITFLHTAEKGTTREDSWLTLRHLPESFGAQFGAVSPVIFVGLAISMWRCAADACGIDVGKPAGLDRTRARFLLAAAAPVAVFYSLLAFHRAIPANWPVVAYLAPFAAAGWYWGKPWDGLQRASFAWAIGVGIAMQLAMAAASTDLLYDLGVPAGLRAVGVPFEARHDPTNRLRGYAELGAGLSQKAAALESRTGRPVFYLSDHYSYAAWAGFYGDRTRPAFAIPHARPQNQYDIWRLEGRTPPIGGDALVIFEVDKGAADVRAMFERVEPDPEDIVVLRGGFEVRRFGVWRAYGFRGFDP